MFHVVDGGKKSVDQLVLKECIRMLNVDKRRATSNRTVAKCLEMRER